jgi:hypothetical protein
MSRNKALMKKRAGGAAPKKIIIKPFQKPPTLPPNYYEQTSRELLEGTLGIIFYPESAQQTQLSLQNSYQQVVNLVSHQYGPQLFRDLVATFQRACQDFVLPSGAKASVEASSKDVLLVYIQTQYQKYVDYLLVCKHVFLPLDRTHAWTAAGDVLKRTASGAVGESGSSTPFPSGGGENALSSSHSTKNTIAGGKHHTTRIHHVMGLWQVGLEQFRRRLHDFLWDDLIYKKWWESLQLDWDENLALDQQALLQSTLYMWQDLGVLAETLSLQLEPDLIRFLQSKSVDLKNNGIDTTAGTGESDGKYTANFVISYCYSKWMHVAYHWSRFLPKSTCVHLLENYLFKPHLSTDWLLNPVVFDPIIEEAFAVVQSAGSVVGNLAGSGSMMTTMSPIQQLWMLAGRLPGGNRLMGTAISSYTRTRGSKLMSAMGDTPGEKAVNTGSAAKAGKQKIADLLELQEQIKQLLAQLPHAKEYCALKHVWEDVVNPSFKDHHNDTNLVAEALAKYVDTCLKDNKRQLSSSPSAATSSDRSDNWIEAIISGVFVHLQAKDVFEAFYKQDLAKRLLWNRVVSMDVERHFVSLLKAECGAGYTSKMEGMFQDMDWSRETMSRYKQTQYQLEQQQQDEYAGGNCKIEMDIQVLTTGYWPVYPQYPNLILPPSLVDPQNRFMDYYKTKYQGRRMTWQYALGHIVVRFKPSDTSGPKYELLVSLCQALVLVQFNTHGDLTLPQLMAAIGLEDRDEVERLLLSLSLGKDGTRVLQKIDHDADRKKKTRQNVHDLDSFRVQSSFKSNARRIRINNILMKETREEREKTVETISRDRLYLIDAVLVRVMKARKTILHHLLIPQVLEQVKVPAQPADVKMQIESLIEREYMERDAVDRNRYNYLA